MQIISNGLIRFTRKIGFLILFVSLSSFLQTTPIQAEEYDFGDAPDSGVGNGVDNYNTLLEDNGPYHTIKPDLRMGPNTIVDAEADGQPTANADGDDTDDNDDDDGVATPLIFLVGEEPIVDVIIANNTSAPAMLYGWIDYDGDGVFSDMYEKASFEVLDGKSRLGRS